MAGWMQYPMYALLIGIGATAVMDLCSVILARLGAMPMSNYALVGRWVAYMPRGRFRHDAIASAAPMPGERTIGWCVHYLTGVAFAGLLLALWGIDWAHRPTLAPALIVGLVTVAAPFLLMQPGMGAGIAASRTPRPGAARIRSLVNHALFGFGLYASGWALRLLHIL